MGKTYKKSSIGGNSRSIGNKAKGQNDAVHDLVSKIDVLPDLGRQDLDRHQRRLALRLRLGHGHNRAIEIILLVQLLVEGGHGRVLMVAER